LNVFEIKSSKTFNKDFFKGIDYLKNIFGDRIKRSALIFDGNSEFSLKQNGTYNFRNFSLETF